MFIKINIKKDIIKAIGAFNIQHKETVDDNEELTRSVIVVDSDSLLFSSRLMSDMALLLGYKDKEILNPDGTVSYPKEIESTMMETFSYIKDNLYSIECIIHQFSAKGGISEGTYIARDDDMIFSKK